MKKGGKRLPQKLDVSNLTQLALVPKVQQGSLFSYQENTIGAAIQQVNELKIPLEIIKESHPSTLDTVLEILFFDFFIDQLSKEFSNQEFQKDDLIRTFNLNSKQVDERLALAVEKNLIVKKTNWRGFG